MKFEKLKKAMEKIISFAKGIDKNIIMFLQIILMIATVYFAYKALIALDIKDAFRQDIGWLWVVAGAVLITASLTVRSFVYSRGILPEMTDRDAIYAIFLGNAMNMILPFKLGEGFRYAAYPKHMTVKERIFIMTYPMLTEIFFVGVCAIMASYFGGIIDTGFKMVIRTVGFTLCSLIVLAVLFLLIFRNIGRHYSEALIRLGGRDYLYSGLYWILVYCATALAFHGAGFTVREMFMAAILAIATTNLALLFPTSPGAVGLFEFAAVSGMSLQGIVGPHAMTGAVLMHLAQYLGVLPVGMGAYVYRKIKMRKERGVRRTRRFRGKLHLSKM